MNKTKTHCVSGADNHNDNDTLEEVHPTIVGGLALQA